MTTFRPTRDQRQNEQQQGRLKPNEWQMRASVPAATPNKSYNTLRIHSKCFQMMRKSNCDNAKHAPADLSMS
eukprot:6196900-Pleurochrysis_carterae.AAC.2